ncbi:MAG: VWA domain-containing protein [Halobacteriales archaeon]|nr:VWA domain-containing protein [Halobacteriales archaeon]
MVWFEMPLALLLIPVAVAVLYYLVLHNGTGSKRRRYALFASRLVVVSLLIVAFAQPFVVETTTVGGGESVQILVDGSDSMGVFEDVADEVASGVENQGIDVTTTRVGDGDESRVGDALMSNVERDGSVLLITDGHVTSGQSLEGAAESASALNARVSAINLTTTESERYVTLGGPGKASAGVEETFEVCVGGTGDSTNEVTVSIDGSPAFEGTTAGGCEEFDHTFEETGDHRMTASIEANDLHERNNEFRKTVRVVERPDILYVSKDRYPLADLLEQLYDVETANEVPSNLDPYYAVVTQNLHADDAGDLSALQDFVIDGNGLVVAGGPNAYDEGGYEDSLLGDIVPVRSGEPDRTSDLVLVIDVSGSAEGDMDVRRGLALDALEQMGDGNRVGVVAFNQEAHRVNDIEELSTSRGEIEDTIARLQSGGSTDIAAGLRGAEEMLGGPGNVVLISDGIVTQDKFASATRAARDLGRQDVNVVSVGVGNTNLGTDVMRTLADESGGSFFQASETDRLSILFGGEDRTPEGNRLTLVDTSHFITQGVETTTDLSSSNEVKVKSTGRFLVSTGSGDVAMASGRYGLGRVVSVTAHTGDGVLGGLLQDPDSLLVSRSVNWAIGDPERRATDVFDVEDTRVGETTEISYRGESRPSTELEFSRTDDDEYVATVTPTEPGFETVGDTEYAVNYALEYGGFGLSNSVYRAVESTGGTVYEPGQTAAIAEEVRTTLSEPRETEQGLEWIPIVLALLLYLVEVSMRRLHDVYGYRFGRFLPSRIRQ